MIEVWFDGVCEPKNPGGYGAYGLYIKNSNSVLLEEGILVGQGKDMSNNVAEYSGFLRALRFFKGKNLHTEEIFVRGDSKLVIMQMFSFWRIKQGLYVKLALKAKEILEDFKKINGQWIPREENEICDKLAKDVLRNMGIKFRLQPE